MSDSDDDGGDLHDRDMVKIMNNESYVRLMYNGKMQWKPFANFSMQVKRHGMDVTETPARERFVLDCVGLENPNMRFSVPLFPLDLTNIEKFLNHLYKYADKHVVFREKLAKRGKIQDYVNSLIGEYSKSGSKTEVAIIDNFGFFTFGVQKSLCFAISPDQVFPCGRNSQSQSFDIVFCGIKPKHPFIIKEGHTVRQTDR